jgi:hypothetical protein
VVSDFNHPDVLVSIVGSRVLPKVTLIGVSLRVRLS